MRQTFLGDNTDTMTDRQTDRHRFCSHVTDLSDKNTPKKTPKTAQLKKLHVVEILQFHVLFTLCWIKTHIRYNI